ncbi:MAG TPA: peptide deformylase [Myxococcaceae bacterium]|nr:peptide deformylase [Myxococcaceae bacterium]
MSKHVVIWPDKVLNKPTKPVTDFGPALEELLQDMRETVREYDGIGLAANQIGVPLRVALVGRRAGLFIEVINPTILEKSGTKNWNEGCLSVPDAWEQLDRAEKVRVRYQDRKGEWHEETAEGKLAHVFQHEIDHLDGTVYVMHISPLKRSLIRERMERLKKDIKAGRIKHPILFTTGNPDR